MQKQLDRLEKKVDQVLEKLENHSERIARTEATQGWIKWTLAFIVSGIGSIALAIVKFK